MTHGMTVTATPACMTPQFRPPRLFAARMLRVTGRVNLLSSVSKIRAAKNSFQQVKKVNSAVVIRPVFVKVDEASGS